MSTVFVSSVISGFESYRDAAARAIEEFGFRPVRSERQPARDIDPKRVLTDLVRESDIFLLILGERYGAPDGVTSPVEDEYGAAVASGKPVLVMVQEGVHREPAQERFIATTSTGWDSGRYRARFANEDQLEKEIIRALMHHERESRGAPAIPGLSVDALLPITVHGDSDLGWMVLVRIEITNHLAQGVSLECDLSVPLNRDGRPGPDGIYLVEKDGPRHWRFLDVAPPWDSPPSALNPLLRGGWLHCPLRVGGHVSEDGWLGFYAPPGLPGGDLKAMLVNDGWSATANLFVRDRVTKWRDRISVPGRLLVNTPEAP